MSPRSERRARLLRLRTIEHRVAALKLADADSEVANLTRIAERLSNLRNSLAVNAGLCAGADLNALAEMSQRLERAHAGIEAPLDDAHLRRSEFLAHRVSAQRREDGAAKLLAKAKGEEVVNYERRTDANRVHIRRAVYFGDVK